MKCVICEICDKRHFNVKLGAIDLFIKKQHVGHQKFKVLCLSRACMHLSSLLAAPQLRIPTRLATRRARGSGS